MVISMHYSSESRRKSDFKNGLHVVFTTTLKLGKVINQNQKAGRINHLTGSLPVQTMKRFPLRIKGYQFKRRFTCSIYDNPLKLGKVIN